MKTLIVDDSPIMRSMLKGLLAQVGTFTIVEATQGVEALALLEKQTVELILLDLHMPKMDGIAFIQELKKRPAIAGIPVVIISSDTESSMIVEALRLGARAYITKPFRLEKLQSALQSIIPAKG